MSCHDEIQPSWFCPGVGGYFAGILACKYKANRLAFQAVEMIMKCVAIKGIDAFQASGVDEDPASGLTVVLQGIDHLECRVTVKVAY